MTANHEMTIGFLGDTPGLPRGLAGRTRVAIALVSACRHIAALTRKRREKRRGDGGLPPETTPDAGDFYNDPALWLLMIH